MIEAFSECPQCGWTTCDHHPITDQNETTTFWCDDCGCEFTAKIYLEPQVSEIEITKRGENHE